ncbi:hypothetical protein LCGC14_2100030, partial [marine sediment metagenome]
MWIFNKIKQAWIWIKRRSKKFWLVITGIIIAPVLAVTLNGEDLIKTPSLTINGQQVEFSYTDDNTDEDLIISTTKG